MCSYGKTRVSSHADTHIALSTSGIKPINPYHSATAVVLREIKYQDGSWEAPVTGLYGTWLQS